MKKTIFIILLCCCLILVGCDYSGSGMIINADGTIKEYYYVVYPEAELTTPIQQGQEAYINFNISRTKILPKIKEECDKLFVGLLDGYQTRVKNSQEISAEEKMELISGVSIASNLPSNLASVIGTYTQIKYEISYANSTCYKLFKQINDYVDEDKEVVEINNFFTTTTKVIKDPILDKITQDAITIGQTCVNLANSIMENELGTALWEQIKDGLNYDKFANTFKYTYVVPSARIHTNADSVERAKNGYYYHTWEIDLQNLSDSGESLIKIEYWTVTANTYVWYICALVISGGIIAGIIIYAKKKEKEKPDNMPFIVE